MLEVVKRYNSDPNVDGILVQLPLPKEIDEKQVTSDSRLSPPTNIDVQILEAIDFEKDVDGIHPLNAGLLAMRGRVPLFVPCTPR